VIFRSLLVGVHRGEHFVYIGRGGTGYSESKVKQVLTKAMEAATSPFTGMGGRARADIEHVTMVFDRSRHADFCSSYKLATSRPRARLFLKEQVFVIRKFHKQRDACAADCRPKRPKASFRH
jgi:hypothetical protein